MARSAEEDRERSDGEADARPQPPEKPLPGDCCDTGCEVCVFDAYSDALIEYQNALDAWNKRHPEKS